LTEKTLLWHYQLHQDVAGERLYFVPLAFTRGFQRETAVAQIRSALRSIGLPSYTIWELVGWYDILLKVWLPPSVEFVDLEGSLLQHVAAPQKLEVKSFSVDRVLFHHLFPEPVAHDPTKPTPEWHFVEVNQPSGPRVTALRTYLSRKLLANPQTRGHTLKFFSFLLARGPDHTSHLDALDLGDRLCELARSCTEVDDVSVFQGHGMARHLISGRVRAERWQAITNFTDTLHGLESSRDNGGTRSITYVAAFPEPLDRREQLLAAETTTPPLEEFLDLRPSQELEFLGSALRPIRPASDAPTDGPIKSVQDRFVSALVSLLNTAGGHLVVGAVSRSVHTLDDLRPRYPSARLTEHHIVIGIESELPQAGWRAYERQLRALIASTVTPDPNVWLTFSEAWHEGTRLLVVIVRRPGHWCYSTSIQHPGNYGQFVGRLDSRPVLMAGPTMDGHRQRYPRATAFRPLSDD
jgi:hypothetical protein